MPRERSETMAIRLTKAERDMLQTLMDEEGRTASQIIREMLHAAHADLSRRQARRSLPRTSVRLGETPQ